MHWCQNTVENGICIVQYTDINNKSETVMLNVDIKPKLFMSFEAEVICERNK